MIELDTILAWLNCNKERYREEYRIKKIGVFGSHARNEQDEENDIDLIVEFEENTKDLYTIKQSIKSEIEKEFNRPVDICREKYIKPYFKNRIQSEARYVEVA